MNAQPDTVSLAPHSVLVTSLSGIIAPIAIAMSAALVAAFSWAKRLGQPGPAKPVAIHAPHVAMVMVPGNFVTGPFTRR